MEEATETSENAETLEPLRNRREAGRSSVGSWIGREGRDGGASIGGGVRGQEDEGPLGI